MTSLKDKYKLFKLNIDLKKQYRLYDDEITVLKKERKGDQEIQEIVAEKNAICRIYEFEIDRMHCRMLIRRAKSLFIDIPESAWDNESGYGLLNEQGKALLNREIRDYKRDRTDLLTKIIATLTGLVGAITGLVAILS
jgi:hypothetical protein